MATQSPCQTLPSTIKTPQIHHRPLDPSPRNSIRMTPRSNTILVVTEYKLGGRACWISVTGTIFVILLVTSTVLEYSKNSFNWPSDTCKWSHQPTIGLVFCRLIRPNKPKVVRLYPRWRILGAHICIRTAYQKANHPPPISPEPLVSECMLYVFTRDAVQSPGRIPATGALLPQMIGCEDGSKKLTHVPEHSSTC